MTVSSIVSMVGNPTNAATIPFIVAFTEPVTGVDVSDFALMTTGLSGAAVASVIGSGDSYTVTVNTGSGDGTLRLDLVDDDSIADFASNPLGGVGAGNGSAIGPSFTVDRTPPTATLTAPLGGVLGLSPFTVNVAFNEAVTGFTAGDLTVANGTVTGFSGSGKSYQATVTPAAAGPVTVGLGAGQATDLAGNSNAAAGDLVVVCFAAGPEQVVNTTAATLSLSEARRTVATDRAGNALVVWADRITFSNYAINAQRYDPAGNKVGGQFLVNTTTNSSQTAPAVAMDADGDAFVVWDGSSGGLRRVLGQRLDAAGNKVGGQLTIATVTVAYATNPTVAMDPTGAAVVVWSGQSAFESRGIIAQRYTAAGAAAGAAFRVNTFSTGDQQRPAVATDAAGNFTIAWDSFGQDGNLYGVYAQRFTAAGAKIGGEFRVNSTTTGLQSWPSIAMDADGDTIIAWASEPVANESDVFLQRYDPAGNTVGGETIVNTVTTGLQGIPAVAMDADGDSVVVWQGGNSIRGQRYDPAGNKIGGETAVVTTGLALTNSAASVALDADGDTTVVWLSSSGVRGRRIDSPNPDTTPPAVSGVVVGDGSTQRSRVTSITVTFSERVTLLPGAFQLVRTGPGSPTGAVDLTVDPSASTPTQTVATLTFTGALTEFGSLTDGRYTLSITGTLYSDLVGLSGSNASVDLHRLFGDANGDAVVNSADFLAFRLAFLTASPTFDVNNDGVVDGTDFLRFRLNFLATV